MNAQKTDNQKNHNNDKAIAELSNKVREIRSRICNRFILAFAIIAVPTLAASLYRITIIGWQPVMAIHIIIAFFLWGIALFRSRVPYVIQAGFIIVVFILIGLGGIFQFGLVSGGIAFIVVTGPIATLLIGGKKGLAALVVVFSGVLVIGLLFVADKLHYTFDVQAYSVTPAAWATSIISWMLASIVLTLSLYVFNKQLIQTLMHAIRNQNALFLSQERLNMVLDGSEQGFWDWNIETGEVLRNDRWAQMLGYETILDFEKNTDSWTNSIFPDDRDAAWKSINDHLEGRTASHKLEYRMLTKDGGYKWILDNAKIVQRDSNDRPLRMSGTHSDITPRKQMEEERESLINSLNSALNELKILRGIIPICSYCHQIRDEEGAWNKIEAYITKHSSAEFSHGICPNCLAKAREDIGVNDKDE